MAEESELLAGAFYWVFPVLDPDRALEWEYFEQPARFCGRSSDGTLIWQYLGVNWMSDWPVRRIGKRIVSEVDEEDRMAVANNDPDGNPVFLFGDARQFDHKDD